MKVRAIAPIHLTAQELTRRQRRYDALCPAGVEVRLDNLPAHDSVPRQLGSAEDIRASEAAVDTHIRSISTSDADVVLPDCVLDPGVRGRADAPVPVRGILELAAGFAATLGLPFTAVARNEAIATELDAVIDHYELEGFSPTRVLHLSFEAIADETVWNDAVTQMATAMASSPVRTVLNGCSAVDVRDRSTGVTVFDPTRIALQLLGVAASNALTLNTEVSTHA